MNSDRQTDRQRFTQTDAEQERCFQTSTAIINMVECWSVSDECFYSLSYRSAFVPVSVVG